MSITFVTFGAIDRATDGTLTSATASARYRALLPGEQLARRGHQVQVMSTTDPQFWSARKYEAIVGDTVVFSKSFDARNEEVVACLKAQGKRVVLDICDNHFEHPLHGPHFTRLAQLADGLIASTPAMARIIETHAGRVPEVIGDPVEGRMSAAQFSPRFPRIKLLWFGHPTNFDSLVAALPAITPLCERYPLELEIVTQAMPVIAGKVEDWNRDAGAIFPFRLTEWSMAATAAALERCDIVLIPSLSNDRKNVKSANRLVESLWAGRCVVAAPIPAYLEFAEYAWLGDNLGQGMLDVIEQPAHWEDRIRLGQQAIAGTLMPYHVANEWERVLVGNEQRPLRLNLGCGDKILPGYVNVDVVESRRGQRPDVLCDLHRLTPFADDAADEILSVHVVEHFWRWEVLDVLKEWVRVLKPGGKMILECPNLESACRTFLEDPVARSREDQQGQRSMWVFYGDPAWQDPYMIHRWGYTPASLAELMQLAGLTSVHPEPAQFKLREPRDMRVVGVKHPGPRATPSA